MRNNSLLLAFGMVSFNLHFCTFAIAHIFRS